MVKRVLRILLFIAVAVLIVMCVVSIGRGISTQPDDAALPQLFEDENTTP